MNDNENKEIAEHQADGEQAEEFKDQLLSLLTRLVESAESIDGLLSSSTNEYGELRVGVRG